MKEAIKSLFQDTTKMLFALVVLSVIVLPTTYSRYIQQEFGSATTYLAKWEVNMIPSEDDNLTLIARNVSTANYLFSITSTSDVACDYSLAIYNVPSDITLNIDDNTNVLTPNQNGTILIENLGGFDLDDDTTHEHTLTFITSSNTMPSDSTNQIELQVNVKQRINNDEEETS